MQREFSTISNHYNHERNKHRESFSTRGFYDDIKALKKSKTSSAEKERELFEMLENRNKIVEEKTKENTDLDEKGIPDNKTENKKRWASSYLHFYEFELNIHLSKK